MMGKGELGHFVRDALRLSRDRICATRASGMCGAWRRRPWRIISALNGDDVEREFDDLPRWGTSRSPRHRGHRHPSCNIRSTASRCPHPSFLAGFWGIQLVVGNHRNFNCSTAILHCPKDHVDPLSLPRRDVVCVSCLRDVMGVHLLALERGGHAA